MLLLLIGHADKKIFRVPNFAFFFFCIWRRNETCNIAKYAHAQLVIVRILRYTITYYRTNTLFFIMITRMISSISIIN